MKSFALALSGGGLLGAAHLGALHFLDKKGARAAGVAGTSAGGLVASLYALHIPMARVIRVGRDITQHPRDYFHLNTRGLIHEIWPSTNPATGLLLPQDFLGALLNLAPDATSTQDWTIPTVLTAVDLVTLTAIAFTNHPPTTGAGRGSPGSRLSSPCKRQWRYLDCFRPRIGTAGFSSMAAPLTRCRSTGRPPSMWDSSLPSMSPHLLTSRRTRWDWQKS